MVSEIVPNGHVSVFCHSPSLPDNFEKRFLLALFRTPSPGAQEAFGICHDQCCCS